MFQVKKISGSRFKVLNLKFKPARKPFIFPADLNPGNRNFIFISEQKKPAMELLPGRIF